MSGRGKTRLKCSVVVLFLLVSLLCTACGGSSGSSDYSGEYYSDSLAGAASNSFSSDYNYDYYDHDYTEKVDQSLENQKWVLTIDLHCETLEYANTYDWIRRTVSDSGGYMEQESEYGNERRSCYFTIRLPVQEADSFVSGLTDSCNITRREENRENVTVQYSDTQNYIASLRVEQTRLMELLSLAESVQDIITIEDRLTDVRTSLERAETRLRTLDNQVDYATISLDLYEVVQYTRTPTTYFGQVVAGFKENFSDTIEAVLNFILWFLTHIPSLLLFGMVVVLLVLFCKWFGKKHPPKHPVVTKQPTWNTPQPPKPNGEQKPVLREVPPDGDDKP